MTIAELTTEQSSSRLRSLVSQNLDLVHKDAALGWFIKANHDWKANPEAEEDTETDENRHGIEKGLANKSVPRRQIVFSGGHGASRERGK